MADGSVEATIEAEVLQEILHRYRALGRWAEGKVVFAAVAQNNTIASNAEEIKSAWRALAGREPLPESSRIWAESDKARAGFAR